MPRIARNDNAVAELAPNAQPKSYEFHPAAEVMPLLVGSDFADLCDDIRKHGQLYPILIFEGKILDGRNRLRACQELSITPWYETLPDTIDPYLRVWSLNGSRRHLTDDQRLAIWAKLSGLSAELRDAKQQSESQAVEPRQDLPRPDGTGPKPSNRTRDRGAKELGRSPRTVGDALAIRHQAPEIADRMVSGDLSLGQARKLARGKSTPKQHTLSRQPSIDPLFASRRFWEQLRYTTRRKFLAVYLVLTPEQQQAFWIERRKLDKPMLVTLQEPNVAQS